MQVQQSGCDALPVKARYLETTAALHVHDSR